MTDFKILLMSAMEAPDCKTSSNEFKFSECHVLHKNIAFNNAKEF